MPRLDKMPATQQPWLSLWWVSWELNWANLRSVRKSSSCIARVRVRIGLALQFELLTFFIYWIHIIAFKSNYAWLFNSWCLRLFLSEMLSCLVLWLKLFSGTKLWTQLACTIHAVSQFFWSVLMQAPAGEAGKGEFPHAIHFQKVWEWENKLRKRQSGSFASAMFVCITHTVCMHVCIWGNLCVCVIYGWDSDSKSILPLSPLPRFRASWDDY